MQNNGGRKSVAEMAEDMRILAARLTNQGNSTQETANANSNTHVDTNSNVQTNAQPDRAPVANMIPRAWAATPANNTQIQPQVALRTRLPNQPPVDPHPQHQRPASPSRSSRENARANPTSRKHRRSKEDEEIENNDARPCKRIRLDNDEEEQRYNTAFNHWGRINADLFHLSDVPPREESVPPTAPIHYISPADLETIPGVNRVIGDTQATRRQQRATNPHNSSLRLAPTANLGNHRRAMDDLLEVDLNPDWWIRAKAQLEAPGWVPPPEEDENPNDAGWLLEEILKSREDDETMK